MLFHIPERLDVRNAAQIEKELLDLLAADQPKELVCDFSGTIYVSSAGLRIMLLISKKMRPAGGKCVLSGMKKPVRDVFKLAGFDAILDIRDSAE